MDCALDKTSANIVFKISPTSSTASLTFSSSSYKLKVLVDTWIQVHKNKMCVYICIYRFIDVYLYTRDIYMCVYIYTHTHTYVLIHFSCAWLSVTPRTAAHQALLSVGFSMQEYWSGLPCPPPGDLPHPGIELGSPAAPAFQADSLPLCHQGSPYICIHIYKWCFFGRFIAKGPLTMISCFSGCDIISKSETIVWWAPGHVVKAEMDTAAELEESEWQHIIWHHLSVTALIISLWLFKWLWALNPKFLFSLKY